MLSLLPHLVCAKPMDTAILEGSLFAPASLPQLRLREASGEPRAVWAACSLLGMPPVRGSISVMATLTGPEQLELYLEWLQATGYWMQWWVARARDGSGHVTQLVVLSRN